MATNPDGEAWHQAAQEIVNKYADERGGEYVDRKRAAKIPAGRDASDENLAKAKREGWNNSGSGREREGEE